MPLQPGQRTPYDFCLSDRRSKQEWLFKLDGGGRAIDRTPMSDDTGGIYLRAVGKKIGDFDEQRSWKSGRGNVYLTDDPASYYDGLNIWSLLTNQLTPTLQWAWATGYRVADMDMPGSVWFRSSIPGTGNERYMAVKFAAGASYSADKCWIWLKRVGNPGTLTMELCSDNAGNPGTVLASATLTAANVSDIVSICYPFNWASTVSLTASTNYWVKVYGASTDSSPHHWEIGCSPSGSNGKTSSDNSSWAGDAFSPFFRVTDADTARRWFFYGDENGFYAVDKKDSGNSQHYTIGGTNPTLTENTSTGLATVSGKPVIASGYHFFPQGDGASGAAIRRWNGTQWRSEATANKATLLTKGFSPTDGAVIWKVLSRTFAQDGATAKVGIMRANSTKNDGTPLTWAADASNMLAFGNIIRIGSTTNGITGIYNWGGSGLFVWKSSSMWVVVSDKVREWDFDGGKFVTPVNGQAAIAASQFLYFNWAHTTKRIFGSTIDDILQSTTSPGMPAGREGVFSAYCSYSGWVFGAIDAGVDGTSSIWVWDERGWHEIFRAPAVGMRIRDVAIQPRTDNAARLWFDCGGDVLYMTLPKFKYGPTDDPTCKYQHEGVVVSSTIDMGAASKLPKFIRELTATTEHLNGQGIRIEVDYQVDDNIGSDSWVHAESFLHSPEDTVKLFVGGITQFRYRLRMMTNNVGVPPVVRGVVPTGYARSPFRWVWSVRVVVGDSVAPGGVKVNRNDLDAWLTEAAIIPGRVYMTSKWPILNGYYVIVGIPTTNPISIPSTGIGEKDTYTFTLVES